MAITAPIPSDARAGRSRRPKLALVPAPVDRPAPNDVIRDLVATQELERRRIARDLHDVVGQALTAVKLSLDALRRDAGSRLTDAELRRNIAIVDQAMRDVRDIAFDVRPSILDDLGLVPAVRWYLERQARIAGYQPTFLADTPLGELDLEIEAACFRTLQEALTNVARHAHATCVLVELRQSEDDMVLLVEDDGVGFDARGSCRQADDHPTLGLLGAAERVELVGGSFEVESRPGAGTRVLASFPRRGPGVSAEGRP